MTITNYHTIGSMDTRDRILDTAQRLIQTKSFHGFSFQDLADEVGIRKASLYHYFDSKDDMALAVLKRVEQGTAARMEKLAGLAPGAKLDGYFDIFRAVHGKGERMCPGGSFASVFDAISSPVQSALHRLSKMHIDWLEDVVREGAERGQFKIGDQRPRDVAMQISAGIQGALLVGRLSGDAHVLDSVADEMRIYLGYGQQATPRKV